jgi:D-arabinose 1-dehydrogenase-like Zn-dependent alcohol dehydrogenase
MKAAVIEKFGHLTVREVPEPPLGDYDALCEMLYGATCAGTDSHILDGSFPWISPLPTILGHESVGRVIKVGSKVRNFRIGDLVSRVGTPALPEAGISVTWGGFVQRGVAKDHWAMAADGVPSAQWTGHRVNQIIPAGIAPQTAPMFITWRESLSYLQRRGFRAGHSLLVLGSGGNGLSFANHAINLGASFVAMTGSPRLAPLIQKQLGVHFYADYKRRDLTEALRDSNRGGYDFIIDAVGQKGMVDTALPALKSGGHLAMYGMDDFKNAPINSTRAQGSFTIHGPGDYDEAETHQLVSEFVLSSKLKAELWYDPSTPYPLTEINEAYRAVRERRQVKALITLAE